MPRPMSVYINPPDGVSKEQFLARYGIETPRATIAQWDFISPVMLPVVWVDNGEFTAAAVAYCPALQEEYLRADARPKKYYLVPVEYLREVTKDLDERMTSLRDRI